MGEAALDVLQPRSLSFEDQGEIQDCFVMNFEINTNIIFIVTDLKRTLADVYEQQEEWQKSAKMLLSAGFKSKFMFSLKIFIIIHNNLYYYILRYLNRLRYRWNLDNEIMMTILNYKYI